jgi:S-adenosyl-L-methionine hydrolase (adenosine-forming)
MTANSLLTLLSDFGWNDIYVGVMKGVIAQINPNARVIDLTHDVPPQNISVAQFNSHLERYMWQWLIQA